MSRGVWLAFVVGAFAASSACDVVLGINGDYSVQNGASASSSVSGTGGASSTSGSTSSASSTASGTGGAAPVVCKPTIATPGCPEGTVRIQGGVSTNSLDNVPKHLDDYCVQTREVTFREYVEIADTHEICFDEPDNLECRGNDPFSLLSPDVFRRPANPDAPMHPADFCDAEAYCHARGLRLCSSDEWRAACANEDAPTPWSGGTHDCVEPDMVEALDETSSTCHGDTPPRDALFDMIGNVAEHAVCLRVDGSDCTDTSHNLVLGALTAIPGLDNATTQENCRTGIGATFRDIIDVDLDGEGGAGGAMKGPVPPEARIGIRCCFTPND